MEINFIEERYTNDTHQWHDYLDSSLRHGRGKYQEPEWTDEDDALDAEEMARYDAEDAARERREAELSA
jgi:hypothetical protein